MLINVFFYLEKDIKYWQRFESILFPVIMIVNLLETTCSPRLTSISHRLISSDSWNWREWSPPYCIHRWWGGATPTSSVKWCYVRLGPRTPHLSNVVPAGERSVCWNVRVWVWRIVLKYGVGIIAIVVPLTEIWGQITRLFLTWSDNMF